MRIAIAAVFAAMVNCDLASDRLARAAEKTIKIRQVIAGVQRASAELMQT